MWELAFSELSPPSSVACSAPYLSSCNLQGRMGFAVHAEANCWVHPHTWTSSDLQVFATWMCSVVLNASFLSSMQRNTWIICVKGVFPIGTLKFCEVSLWSKLRVSWCDRTMLERFLPTLYILFRSVFPVGSVEYFFSNGKFISWCSFFLFPLGSFPHFC